MTCAEFHAAVVDIASEREVSLEAAGHAAQCEACAEALAAQREISGELEMLAREFRFARPGTNVEQELVRAFREKRSPSGNAPGATSAPQPVRQDWLRFAAAVFVIFGFGAWMLLSREGPVSRRTAVDARDGVPPAAFTAGTVSEFVPVLGYGPVSAADSGTVVRVLLPQEAFQYFAVPVPGMPGGQRFPADVLLADDGSVRAIRLVSASGGRR